MDRILLIDADLACPPSEVYTFRSFTLFAACLCDYQNLAEVPNWEFRDTYWRWYKDHDLLDHVYDLVDNESVVGVRFSMPRLTCENLNSALQAIGFSFGKWDRRKRF
jgi:hypothetical protein